MIDLVTRAMPISDGLLGWFVETTLVASALAILAALAARVPRLAASPAAKHALWLMVLLKLVTPPIIHWPWSVPSPLAMTRPESSRAGDESNIPIHDVVVMPSCTDSAVISRLVGPGPASTDPQDREGSSKAPGSAFPGEKAEISILDSFLAIPPPSQSPGEWIVAAWLFGSIAIGLVQARSVVRFRRLLLDATPAPSWLVWESELIGRHLSVRVPPILVVPRLGTPVLWCLGRPVLLVPAKLLQTLEAERWGAILAHELAHLRRGDHWVRRLELLAGLVWWWNPLYWLARHRLDYEAELACDAWAVWASPKDRHSYAESLLRICTTLSSAESAAPALGIIGTGRSFERRLTMILRSRVDRHISVPSLVVGSLLAGLSLPSWTLASPTHLENKPASVAPPLIAPSPLDDELAVGPIDDDDDDDKDAAESKEKGAKLKAEKAAKLKAEKAALNQQQDALKQKLEALSKEMEAKFGPSSEFAKEIEKNYGPGSEFAKKMEAMGKEMEVKFGPGSEFVKKMEAMGKEMEAKFGPGSDFAKEIEKKFGADSQFAKEIENEFGADSQFAKKIMESIKEGTKGDGDPEAKKAKLKAVLKAKAEADRARANAEKAREVAKNPKPDPRPNPDPRPKKVEAKVRVEARVKASNAERRAKQIETLESRIQSMMDQLKKLKAEAAAQDKDEDEEEEEDKEV